MLDEAYTEPCSSVAWVGPEAAAPVQLPPVHADSSSHSALLKTYCVTCHSDRLRTGGLSLEHADLADVPKGAEYANAVRDLLGLDIDAAAVLPPDDESSGFDNIADVLTISPSLMERYLSASWNISRQAVGNPNIAPSTVTYRVRPDLSQDQHIEGLPPGTRGGMLVQHAFPLDGEYTIKLRLWRNTFDLMRGMEDPHDIEIAMDGQRLALVTAGGREDFMRMAENPGTFGADLDRRLTVTLPVRAGTHTLWATTVLRSHAVRDDLIKPFIRTTVDGLDIMGDPSVDRLTLEGPHSATGPGDTASRRNFYRQGRAGVTDAAFDRGIEAALQFILASPEFLIRFESDPPKLAPNAVYRLDDLALASRLSFFLWSSLPDDELLTLASQRKLSEGLTSYILSAASEILGFGDAVRHATPPAPAEPMERSSGINSCLSTDAES